MYKDPHVQSEKGKAYYAIHKDRIAKKASLWNRQNRVRRAQIAKKWNDANTARKCFYKRMRDAAKLQQTPPWLTKEQKKEMLSMYILASELSWLSEGGLHVDHIVPLQGKEVRGLHVPWNLQILPAPTNMQKSNRWTQ